MARILIFMFIAILNASCAVSKDVVDVVVSETKGEKYYHIDYSLNKENIHSIETTTDDELAINGGQFELLVKKEEFPINAPNCKSNIIVRMPWTNPSLKSGNAFIAEKIKAYRSIMELLKSGEKSSLNIFLELNPYITVVDGNIELSQCNVFFRHSNGRYIQKLGSLE